MFSSSPKRPDVSILKTPISNAAIVWRQDSNEMTSKNTPDEFLDFWKTAKRTKLHKCYNRSMKCAKIVFYMIPNYLYSQFLVCVQALHFFFNVVISNTFNCIFETDLLRDIIN